MARTFHHSRKHGPRHRWNIPHGNWITGGCRRGEARGWWVRLFDTRPQRYRDHQTLRALLQTPEDADGIVWTYTGTKRPHTYYW